MTQEQLALEVTRLAKAASSIISNPNSTPQDRMALNEILEELDQRKAELRNIKQKYSDFKR